MSSISTAQIGRTFREESGRSVATLIRIFGDIDLAEDAVQEAFAVALRKWPRDGVPPNPGGWITTTARNRAIDRLRRSTREKDLLGDVAQDLRDDEQAAMAIDGDESAAESDPVDDRLRLIFTCCHPALAIEAQVALTLRLLGGLATEDVARAFLVSEPTMAQRLVRAKRKIKAARIPYRMPAGDELPTRIRPVLSVLYLIYNAGADGPSGSELRSEAIRLSRAVAELMPDEQEVAGLLALVLLLESRQRARYAETGALVRLSEQERSQWDRAMIEEGQTILRACIQANRPGPYQIQAAINAVHVDAASADMTDWAQILALYDQLFSMAPTPIVALNRAIALGEVKGPAAALELIEGLDLDGYHLFHATRADFLQRLSRIEEATAAYKRAAELAPGDTDRRFLESRLAEIEAAG